VCDPAEVGDVVVPDRVVTAAEQDLVGVDDPWVRLNLRWREVLEDPAEGIAGHQPREQEVDRQRDPNREDV